MGPEEIIMSFLASSSYSTLSKIPSRLMDSEENIRLDQLAKIGYIKTQPDLFPFDSEVMDVMTELVEDFEVFLHNGFTVSEARDICRLVYVPRVYLVQSGDISDTLVRDLSDDEVEKLVDNSLLTFFEYNGIDPEEDLNYNVAGIENTPEFEPFLERLKA